MAAAVAGSGGAVADGRQGPIARVRKRGPPHRAARRRARPRAAGRRFRAFRRRSAELLSQWALAELAPGPAAAVAAGRVRLRHRRSISPPTASRPGGRRSASPLAAVAIAILARRRADRVSARARLRRASPRALPSPRCRPRASRIRCWRDRPAASPSRASSKSREERERTDRIVVRVATIEAPAPDAERPSASASAVRKGTAPPVGAFIDVQGAAVAAAAAAAARRLRFRPRSVFPGHRRDRLRARRDQAATAPRRAGGCGCATPPSIDRHPRRHRRAHPRRACPATAARSPRR